MYAAFQTLLFSVLNSKVSDENFMKLIHNICSIELDIYV